MNDSNNEPATDDSDKRLIVELSTGVMLAVTATGVLHGANDETLNYAGEVLESEVAKYCKGKGQYGVDLECVAAGTMHEKMALASLVANCVDKIALFREPA